MGLLLAGMLLLQTRMLLADGDDTKEYMVDGIKVIQREVPKEVISVRVFIVGGTANYPASEQGIEDMTLDLMINGGTESMSKLDFQSAAEKIGTQFNSSTTLDYGELGMSCIKDFWDDSWNLLSDAIMHPAFAQNEFTLLQQKDVASAKQTQADPDSYLANLSRKNAFDGKDYAKIPSGTPESLQKLTIDDVKNYYRTILGKKRIFIVIVGDVNQDDITKKIHSSLASMPDGLPIKRDTRTFITEPKVYVEDRNIATNYIRGIMSAPYANSQEGVAMRISMDILYDRFFTELRTKRSLSYAPAAFYASGAITNPYSVIYISTTDPKQSMDVMVAILDSIKANGFNQDELDDTRQKFLTDYYLTLETTAGIAEALGAAEVQGGWEELDKFNDEVAKTTLSDIDKTFDKYTQAIVWTYLGKKDQVQDDDFKQADQKPKKNKPY